jgi:uncharacterized protein (UPF0333 family)
MNFHLHTRGVELEFSVVVVVVVVVVVNRSSTYLHL